MYFFTISAGRGCACDGSPPNSRRARRCRKRSQHWSSSTWTAARRRVSSSEILTSLEERVFLVHQAADAPEYTCIQVGLIHGVSSFGMALASIGTSRQARITWTWVLVET
jgi:hypothetical protein